MEVDNESTWLDFKSSLNSFGSSKWVVTEPSTSVNFLDLNISINLHNKIEISTFQKAMNLHLYIPPSSTHPPSCLKGLITSKLFRYKRQNSNMDLATITTSCLGSMAARGHNLDDLTPLIHEAAVTIDKKLFTSHVKNSETPSIDPSKDQKSLYFHWQYILTESPTPL